MTTIYVLGDSFSAGAELEDTTFLSFHSYAPKNTTEYFKWISSKDYQNELSARPNYVKFFAELERAWPAKLAERAGVTVINKSFGGSSPAMWKAKVLHDFIQYSETNTTIDIAIIQISDYNRTCLYTTSEHNTIKYVNLSTHHLTYGTTEEKSFMKHRMMIQDDLGDLYNFLLDLANIKMTLIMYGVKTIKFIGSNSHSFFTEQAIAHQKIDEISKLIKFLELDFFNMYYMIDDAEKLPGGHVSEKDHEKTAHYMKSLLNL